MKVGSPVRNEYQGIVRYGKVKKTFKGNDGWTWCEVDWVDDDQYQEAIKHRNNITSQDYFKNYYRVDELYQIDVNKTIETLVKLK